MRRSLHENGRWFMAIGGVMVLALVVSGYILHHQRLRLPFIDEGTWTLRAEFPTAQAIVPGQGQTVRVSGIRIGDISSVRLRDGRALVSMQVDDSYRGLVRRDASALLRPRTGLKDMFIELTPGTAPGRVPDGFTMPVSRTLPDVNTDEILAALDTDTRTYLRFLLHDLSTGLHGRGATLGELLRRLEPTHRQLARVSTTVAARRNELRRLVDHLADLNGELARNDTALTKLVGRSAVVFRTLGEREGRIAATVRGLPGGLRATTDALRRVHRLADVIPSATTRLTPVLAQLTKTNRQITPTARAVAPVLRDSIRPFTRAAQPLVAQLRRPSADLNRAAGDLTEGTRAFNHLFNEVAYNPNGREAPTVAGREEGYLFWIAWLGHQSVNLFNTADAHGTFRPIGLSATCSTLRSVIGEQPAAEFVLGLTPLLTSPDGCGSLNLPAPTLRRKGAR